MNKVFTLILLFLFPLTFSATDEDLSRLDPRIPIRSSDPQIYTYTHDGTWTLKKHSDKGDVVIEIPFVEKTGVFTKQEWGHIKSLMISSALLSGLISMISVVTVEYFNHK